MNLCGIDINCFHADRLLSLPDEAELVVTVNAEAIVRAHECPKLWGIMNTHVTTIDGQIPLWLFRFLYKHVDIEKISGSDLIYVICEWASRNDKRVFLLGGDAGSNASSVDRLKEKYPGLRIGGFSPEYAPYPFTPENNERILSEIGNFRPDILFVGFGMGKQEYWASDCLEVLDSLGVRLIVGCGGTFDFVSGRIKRAPRWVQNVGLESFWRLFHELKWFRVKRIFISLKIFLYFYKQHIEGKRHFRNV